MEATRTALKHYPQTAPNTNLRNQESSATNYSDCHDTLLGHQLCPLLCIYSNYPQTLLVLQVVHVGGCVRFVLHGVRTLMISRLCQMCADVIEVCVVVILGNAGGDQHIRVALSGRCVAVCWCDCLGATQTAFKHYPRQPQTLPTEPRVLCHRLPRLSRCIVCQPALLCNYSHYPHTTCTPGGSSPGSRQDRI